MIAAALLTAGLAGCDSEPRALSVSCAAGMREPMERLAARFEAEQGVPITLRFGGSNTLLGQIAITGRGDLFMAADASYIEAARRGGLAADSFFVARVTPVVIFREDRRRPESMHDLLQSETRVAIGDPEAAAIGRATRLACSETGVWEAFRDAVSDRGVTFPTVQGVANAVALGAVDYGIVWDAVAGRYESLESAALADLAPGGGSVAVAVLSGSRRPREAADFAAFVADSDIGRETFAAYGFDTSRDRPGGRVP